MNNPNSLQYLIKSCMDAMSPWASNSNDVRIHVDVIYSTNAEKEYQVYPELKSAGYYRDSLSGYGSSEEEALAECLANIKRQVKKE